MSKSWQARRKERVRRANEERRAAERASARRRHHQRAGHKWDGRKALLQEPCEVVEVESNVEAAQEPRSNPAMLRHAVR